VAFSYQGSDFVRPISEAQPDISGLQLSEQERAMFLDLGPYVNPSYYVVQVRCGNTCYNRCGLDAHVSCLQEVLQLWDLGVVSRTCCSHPKQGIGVRLHDHTV
jgi:hypothetical protein